MLLICLALLQNPEDKPRFEEFYNKFYDTMFYIAKDHLKSKEAAEDCAQEIMMRFARDFHNIKQDFNDKSFKNYVRVVSKGMAIDMYRKEKKHIENIVNADISDFNDLSAEEFEVCNLMVLKQAMDAMPESYKSAFHMKYLFEYSGAEIAKRLGISEPLVRRRCMLGAQFVRNFVKETEKE